MRLAAPTLLLTFGTASAAIIAIPHSNGYDHAAGVLVRQRTQSIPSLFTTPDSGNLARFGWTLTSTAAFTLRNMNFFGCLDAEMDRIQNTYSNEYRLFFSLALPSALPGGTISATSGQIDEPGFAFGTIRNDLAAGPLQNANIVSSAARDGDSLTLGSQMEDVAHGGTAALTLRLWPANIGGMQQFDPEAGIVRAGRVLAAQFDFPMKDAAKWPVALRGSGRGGAPLIADADSGGEPSTGVAGLKNDGTGNWQAPIPDHALNLASFSVFDFEVADQAKLEHWINN